MNDNKPYKPVFRWRPTWEDQPQDFTAKPPQRKTTTMRMHWETGPNGEGRWSWVVNDWKKVAEGYAETHLEAARKAETAFIEFLKQPEE
ncbi:hypothetical protein PsAD5_02158 [Pseudovibrio sp. Ad5]|uniref:hypothetical protein n=1 Tax=Pseudovibrio sp. Ad5 TaxID=989436 RepID=UPI0007AE93A4|nr:hypothetical protein [Pseudovibrio sp. Ad5]KZK97919.1 hypothetical protein PsAD5_02158 [Pseudovibrio sp. Ad5]